MAREEVLVACTDVTKARAILILVQAHDLSRPMVNGMLFHLPS